MIITGDCTCYKARSSPYLKGRVVNSPPIQATMDSTSQIWLVRTGVVPTQPVAKTHKSNSSHSLKPISLSSSVTKQSILTSIRDKKLVNPLISALRRSLRSRILSRVTKWTWRHEAKLHHATKCWSGAHSPTPKIGMVREQTSQKR